MILEYVKGLIFVVLFLILISMFGKSIIRSDNFSENLIIGFILYTALQFFGGFLCQQMRLPWLVYQLFMICLLTFIIYNLYQSKITIHCSQLFSHMREYWFLYTVALVLVFLALMNLDYIWNGNNTDDGYYLNKIAMAPYVSSYVDYNYATGFLAPSTIVRNLNTFEIEAAFFCQLLGMEAAIYAKVFLSFIHYVLLLNSIYWFYQMMDSGKMKNLLIYALIPVLFFGIYQEVMLENHMIVMVDAWQFNSAMWYGSTLVRTAGFFMLMTPLLKKEITMTERFFLLGITSCALISKSSQALPLIFLVCMSTLILYLISAFQKYNNVKLLAGIGVLIFGCVLVPLPTRLQTRAAGIQALIVENMHSLILIVSILVILIAFYFGNYKMRKWSIWILLIGGLIFIPRLNHLFLILSFYDFVANRMVTLYYFTIIMSASLYIFIGMSKYINKRLVYYILYFIVACICVNYPLKYIQSHHGLKFSVRILMEHDYLMPKATMELGEKLEIMKQNREEPLYVLSPMWFKNYNIPHSPATSLRYQAFDIYSIGACGRYPDIDEGLPFASYTEKDQLIFDMYNSGEDRNNDKLKSVLDRFPINCIIVTYEDAANSLGSLGYRIEEQVPLDDTFTYYILLKQ